LYGGHYLKTFERGNHDRCSQDIFIVLQKDVSGEDATGRRFVIVKMFHDYSFFFNDYVKINTDVNKNLILRTYKTCKLDKSLFKFIYQ
jgi:hypothetical protein